MTQAKIDKAKHKAKFAPVLGLSWNLEGGEKTPVNCKTDETIQISELFTKKKILLVTQKIFNLIGFINSCELTLTPKLILQKTYLSKDKWLQTEE